MREIKFRAWNKKVEQMLTVDVLDWCDQMENGKETGFVGHKEGIPDLEEYIEGYPRYEDRYASDWKDIILMQYTGLKDKNGKECYEGDIIRAKANPADTPRKSKVFWTNHGWQVCLKKVNRFLSDLIEFEIIGDIYTTPELLVKKIK